MCATRTITHIYIIHIHYTCTVEVHCTNIHTESVHVCKHIYTSTYIRISCVLIYIIPPPTSYIYARTHVHATHTYTSARVYPLMCLRLIHTTYEQVYSTQTAHTYIYPAKLYAHTIHTRVTHAMCKHITHIMRTHVRNTRTDTTGLFHMYTRVHK